MAVPSEIVIVGSINFDLVVCAPRIPSPGETVLGSDLQQFSGGKGANQAVASSRLGASVRMVGCVGNDGFGKQLISELEDNGVDTRYVATIGEKPSGVALITVDSGGQNSIVVSPGANVGVSSSYIRSCSDAFDGCRVLVLQLETPLDGILEAARIAKERGMRVILNPAPARELPQELLNLIDDIIPNQSELALLSGTDDVEKGILELQKRGVRNIIVTLGSSGAVLAQGVDRHSFPAYNVKAVDTTAAGDSFVGAYAVALAEGATEAMACQMGVAAGAISVTASGAQASLPRRSAVDAMLLGTAA